MLSTDVGAKRGEAAELRLGASPTRMVAANSMEAACGTGHELRVLVNSGQRVRALGRCYSRADRKRLYCSGCPRCSGASSTPRPRRSREKLELLHAQLVEWIAAKHARMMMTAQERSGWCCLPSVEAVVEDKTKRGKLRPCVD